MNANAVRREELKARLAADEPPPLLHPEMARIYREKVTELARALQEEESRPEATEALRGLVDAILLTPDGTGKNSGSSYGATSQPCWGPPYKRRGRRSPTTSPCKYLWLQGWDSNSHASFRLCKLQIPRCRGCREYQRCRGALPAIARRLCRQRRRSEEFRFLGGSPAPNPLIPKRSESRIQYSDDGGRRTTQQSALGPAYAGSAPPRDAQKRGSTS